MQRIMPAPIGLLLALLGPVAQDAAAQSTLRAPPPRAGAKSVCSNCGTILSVRRVKVAVNPMKSRRADRLSEAGEARVGVVDGPIVGRNAGQIALKRTEWEVLVMLESGSTARIRQAYMPGYPTGSRVRIVRGGLQPR